MVCQLLWTFSGAGNPPDMRMRRNSRNLIVWMVPLSTDGGLWPTDGISALSASPSPGPVRVAGSYYPDVDRARFDECP